MFAKKLIIMSLIITIMLGGAVARAQDSGALLDLLVRKKLITDQDAEEVAHVEAIFCQSFSRAARRRALSALSTPARTPITMSSAGKIS